MKDGYAIGPRHQVGRQHLGRGTIGQDAAPGQQDQPGAVARGQPKVMERGKDRALTLDARVRPAGVSVFVSDEKGNDLQGTVFVDGRRVGEAYETLKVPLCSQRLQLDAGDKKYSVQLVGQLLEKRRFE